MGGKKKVDIEYSFEHGEVINYTYGWCINTHSHYKDTGVIPNSIAGEEGNCSGISPWANGDFKTVTV